MPVPQPSDCFFFGATFFAGAGFAGAGADDFKLFATGATGSAAGVASAGAAPADLLAAEPAALFWTAGVGESAGAEEFTVGRRNGAPIGRPR
ncbi:hypothetical protein BXP70_01310 [Hymenobacter crusticola]|uniref:Uncharacterized protein n=1 Tax=Hymenobacter crusticola TaxID=1770526 RepID=A0A243WJ79_9BACT|nr:hypothetical protein BXP70_01310 [Hymenobacter crusticola]